MGGYRKEKVRGKESKRRGGRRREAEGLGKNRGEGSDRGREKRNF